MRCATCACGSPETSCSLRGRLQTLADGAAVVAVEREQVHVDARAAAQMLEQRHGQQTRGMRAEAIGEETERARWAHRCAVGGGGNGRIAWAIGAGAQSRAMQLFGALASSLRNANGSTAARRARTASRTCAASASRSRQSHSLRRHASRYAASCGSSRRQRVRMGVGFAAASASPVSSSACASQTAMPGWWGALFGGGAQAGYGLPAQALHPLRAPEPRQCLRMPGPQRQCTPGRSLAGARVAAVEFVLGQHDPRERIAWIALQCVAHARCAGRDVGHASGRSMRALVTASDQRRLYHWVSSSCQPRGPYSAARRGCRGMVSSITPDRAVVAREAARRASSSACATPWRRASCVDEQIVEHPHARRAHRGEHRIELGEAGRRARRSRR